jgi:rhodanese-related sulfurtransferase
MFKNVDNEGLRQLMDADPDLRVLDVRTPPEYYGLGHIPRAELLPVQELPTSMADLVPGQPIAVLCQHGVRSAHAAHYLAEQGFTTLYNLTDGMAGWDGDLSFE